MEEILMKRLTYLKPFIVALVVGISSGLKCQDPGPNLKDREEMLLERKNYVVGLEMEGNDFRSRTPALKKCARKAVRVDRNVLYERKMAMYKEGATFEDDLPEAAGTTEKKENERAGTGKKDVPLAEEGHRGWIWIGMMFVVLGGGIGFIIARKKLLGT